MIRVTKPPCPDALLAGAERTKADCAAYDENADAYSNGEKRFDFRRAIYGHKTIRTALREAQHRKCCYCEAAAEAAADVKPASTSTRGCAGSVEHYRPKGSVRQDQKSKKLFPGYYWLAYSWNNLYWCCQECNGRKNDFFPLKDPAARARFHLDDVSGEEPLLLDPGGSGDPREHIRFREEYADGLTGAGQTTIGVLGLNREALLDERLKRLKKLRALRDLIRLCADSTKPDRIALREGARNTLDRAASPSEIFSAMAADLLLEDQAGADAP